jgi:hypothetical protein
MTLPPVACPLRVAAYVPLPESAALRDRPNLRRQVWSRGPQPLKGATPVARQSRFHGVHHLDHFMRCALEELK